MGDRREAQDALEVSLSGSRAEVGAPARDGAPTGALSLREQMSLVGHYRWIEDRAFELLGSWVMDEPSEQARLLFDTQSQQHAWHAELFYDRLPVLDWVDRDGLSVPPSDEVERSLTAIGAAPTTLRRLVGMGRFLLPRLVAGYTLHLHRARAVADAALIRALRLVARDEIESWQATEAMAQAAIEDEEDVVAAADHLRLLEGLVAGIGPGLVAWPDASSV